MPPVFWIYLVGAGLVAAGFADFSLMAYHFEKASVIPNIWVPVFYSVAMGVSASDRCSSDICLIALELDTSSVDPHCGSISAAGFPRRILGGAHRLRAVGPWMGVHESIIPPLLRPWSRTAPAFCLRNFHGWLWVSWFVGSVIIGRLYDVSVFALIVFSVLAQMVAIPIFVNVNKRLRTSFN